MSFLFPWSIFRVNLPITHKHIDIYGLTHLPSEEAKLIPATPLNSLQSTKTKLWRKSNREVYSEYVPVDQKQHKSSQTTHGDYFLFKNYLQNVQKLFINSAL